MLQGFLSPRLARPMILPFFVSFRIALFLVALSACILRVAGAQAHPPSEYTLREWHESEGLPSDELVAVLHDAAGFLWVASNGEIARFDGGTFETMPAPPGGFMRGAMLRAEAGGQLSTLVIPGARAELETEAGWFVLGASGRFAFEAESALAGRVPRSGFDAPDGARWVGCEDGTLLRRFRNSIVVFDPPPDLTGKKIPVFATDAAGHVWISRGNRLHRFASGRLIDLPVEEAHPELYIASSRSGGVWVFTRSALLRWNGTALQTVVALPELLSAHFVQAVHEDRNGYLWIGTRSQGLNRVAGGEILPVPTSGEEVTSLCEDRDGSIWAATNGGGLSRLRAKAHQLVDQSSGLLDSFSYTVAADASGTIWLGNRDGGVARVHQGVVDPISRRADWRPFSSKSVFPAPDGTIWITTGVGVFRTNVRDPETSAREESLAGFRNVRSTFVARNGDYWLAADPDRVARWREGQVRSFGPDEGFAGREVRAFAEDANGRIWLGAADGRLYRSAGDRFERVDFPLADDCGALQVIRFESDGTMLLGTTRRGVLVFPRGHAASLRTLDTAHGLADNNVSQILLDDFDRYWFAARRGISWVHGRHVRDFIQGTADHVHAIKLGRDDGLPFLSCLGLYQPAAWKAGDGTLWFATRRGVLRTEPALLADADGSPPPVAISSFACDGQRQPPGPEATISSTVRKIQIHLSALNLSAPESVQVRYLLDGFDDDWVVLGADRIATYPRLPPGRYVFQTMASNGTGSWSREPALLTLHVRPPWWQSWWAQASYLLALVAAVGASVRTWSHRRLRRRLERSEQAHAVERERTRIAQNIHDDLGATLTRISLLTQAAQQESAAHSPTLDKIYESTRSITRSMDEIVWAINPRHDNAESLVYYLGNFAQGFLGEAGIRCRLELPDTLPDAALTSQVRHNLFLCCKEALNNLVKHADASEASVQVTLAPDRLEITVADNGRGIDGMPGRSRGSLASWRTTGGNGVSNLHRRMTEVRGTCAITAGASGGTIVTLTVPILPRNGA